MSEGELKIRRLSLETATEALQRLLEFNEIDYEDEDGVTEHTEDGESIDVGAELRSNHRKLIKAIQKGRLVVNDDGHRVTCTQHLKIADKLTGPFEWGVISGRTGRLAAKTNIKATDFDGQVLCLIASMTGRELKEVYSLEGPDYTLAKALGMLFFVA
ncbi:MAG: hypothetical protein ACWGMZ_04070 [Thermoguttaceae bacterium]